MIFKGMHMKSGSGKILFKLKCLISANRHLAPGVDTTLLKKHFAVVTGAVGELRFPVKSNNFPLTVNLVRSFSYFSGFTSQTILPYVTFFSLETWYLRMNMTLFSPFTPLIPWSNCPNFFAKDISPIILSGPLIRCLYSWDNPDILWETELASWGFWHCAVNA